MVLRPRSDLRSAQLWGAGKIQELPALMLAWDCGAGKTGAVLTALRDLLDTWEARKVLVVAPLIVANTTWPDEIETWEHTCAISYSVIGGNEAERVAALKVDAEIYTINRENLPWLWITYLRNGADWDFDTLIIDESTIAKSGRKHSAGKVDDSGVKRRGALSRFGVLARARKRVKRVVEMTGTPAPNGVKNLWGQAYLIDLGERLGADKRAFEDRWFSRNQTPFGTILKPHPHSEGEIMGLLKDVMFSLGPEDYGELPPMVMNNVKVRLKPKILQQYKQFARTLVSEPYDVEAVNKGVLTNKLLQFANGSMYQESGDDVWVHDEKLEALESLVEEANGATLLVAYSFKFDLARIRRKYPKAVVLNEERDARETIRRWNDSQIDMLLAHRASAGHGLNMQQGGHIAIQYGLTHDLELYLQFNKRLHRSGQLHTVFNHHIITEQTADEDVLPLFIQPKGDLQTRVLEAVRVRLYGT